jgi:peptidoglycan/xylan/chitin deacetylase (PgdA/CDA1 family)
MRRVIMIFALIAPLLAIALWRWSPWAAIGIVALSHMLLLYPTLVPNCQWLGPVITRFETSERELWLTIDDGLTADTPALLELLHARGVRATFFAIGSPAYDVVGRGHTVANHSRSHPSGTFWRLGPRAVAREIDGGVQSRWFRAPVGMKNPFVHPALARRGMRLIGWTARGFDATMSDAERVTARIAAQLEPGAIVVMHQGREWSLRCIDRVIEEAQQRGYRFVIPDDGALSSRA